MGRRYYCEYCDRSFTDVVNSRKKHLNGVAHQRWKKVYYSKVRDLKTLVLEERQKDICKRFRSTGTCPFEEACTFTHYTPYELSVFESQLREEERKRNELPVLPSIQDWINKRSAIKSSNVVDAATVYGDDNPLKSYDYNTLPLSLRPMLFKDLMNTEFVEWGLRR